MRALHNQTVGPLAAHRRMELMITRWTKIARMRGIKIPHWVPRELIVEFCDCACEHGEEHAASHVRKRKKEMGL